MTTLTSPIVTWTATGISKMETMILAIRAQARYLLRQVRIAISRKFKIWVDLHFYSQIPPLPPLRDQAV